MVEQSSDPSLLRSLKTLRSAQVEYVEGGNFMIGAWGIDPAAHTFVYVTGGPNHTTEYIGTLRQQPDGQWVAEIVGRGHGHR